MQEPGDKNVGGRPTDYRTAFNKQAEKLCKLGSTDKELADFFEVTEQTINNWKVEHPKFFESIKKGKEIADAEVAEKLFKRATGYQHADVDIKMFEGQIITTPLTKHYPPDTAAAIFWLKNRQKDKWRDKQEHDIRTPDGLVINFVDQDGNAPLTD
ncbi:hypothetical protein [Flavitalea sp.]|nr:hypothetical protein [Flavitalea sp.]